VLPVEALLHEIKGALKRADDAQRHEQVFDYPGSSTVDAGRYVIPVLRSAREEMQTPAPIRVRSLRPGLQLSGPPGSLPSGGRKNSSIDRQLQTVPLRSLMRVITGQNRKASLFIPADEMAPD